MQLPTAVQPIFAEDLVAADTPQRPWPWLPVWLRVLLVVLPVAAVGTIAYQTRFNVHPDEYIHVDAFDWFRHHAWRPILGDDRLQYSYMGWSRVFTGEVVYWLFGRVTAAVDTVTSVPEPAYVFYRMLNVALLAATLVYCFFVSRCRLISPHVAAMAILCLPQAMYVYGYANSDGWGLSFNVILFLYTAELVDRPRSAWRWWRVVTLMLLVLAVLLSKTPFLLGLVLPGVLVLGWVVRTWWLGRRSGAGLTPTWLLTRLAVPLVAVMLLAGWFNPSLSWNRAGWKSDVVAMREAKARRGHKPSNPWAWGMDRAGKGETYATLLTGTPWLASNFQSFYSRFGGWSVEHPDWPFAVAAYLGLMTFVMSLAFSVLAAKRLSWPLMACLALTLPLIAVNFYGTVYHSLHVDFQPQGRYLFPSLVPLTLLLWGTLDAQRPNLRLLHAASFVMLIPLALYVLTRYAAVESSLR